MEKPFTKFNLEGESLWRMTARSKLMAASLAVVNVHQGTVFQFAININPRPKLLPTLVTLQYTKWGFSTMGFFSGHSFFLRSVYRLYWIILFTKSCKNLNPQFRSSRKISSAPQNKCRIIRCMMYYYTKLITAVTILYILLAPSFFRFLLLFRFHCLIDQ